MGFGGCDLSRPRAKHVFCSPARFACTGSAVGQCTNQAEQGIIGRAVKQRPSGIVVRADEYRTRIRFQDLNMAAPIDESTLPFATIPELSAFLRNREISIEELTRLFSRRLKEIGPKYNALALPLEQPAHRTAKEAQRDFKDELIRSPLHGIPYGAKDLLSFAKHPTTWGAKPYQDQVFDYSATVLEKLDHSGAIITGKLSMIELAGGGGYGSASASLQGPGLNPWNTAYWAGGSSTGSAIAVAAGLAPFALGSETSGSILTPACYCGVTGLRPTYGLVSRYGAMALSWTLDKIGVLAHTADDCGLVLHQIAGKDEKDPGTSGKSFFYSPKYYRDSIPQLRFGYAEVDWSEWPDAPLRPAFAQALSIVKSVGATMQETRLPEYPFGAVIGTIIDAEAASIFEPLIRSSHVQELADRDQIDGLIASLSYSALDYLKAMRVRRQIIEDMRKLFEDVDLLVGPVHFELPDRADQPFVDTPPKQLPQGVAHGLTQFGNLCGLPAVAIPCGFVNGLPIGLQIVGPPFSENRILAFAQEFQARTDFHLQHPPVAA